VNDLCKILPFNDHFCSKKGKMSWHFWASGSELRILTAAVFEYFRGMFTSFLHSGFWRKSGRQVLPWSISLLLAIILSTGAAMGFTWVTVTVDTSRYILSAIMGVSGSIIGFLVIYLTFAFEGIRRFFGRNSNSIFLRDSFIWFLCRFFSGIILVSLLALCVVDHPGWWWRWVFNFSCFSFLIGISMIVPFGKMILKRTDTAVEIRHLIDSITVNDFREPPRQNWYLGPSYWIITEQLHNPVDKITSILMHNIAEKNNNVVANMLKAIFARIQILMGETQGSGGERAALRYHDILLLAFDQAKGQNDPLVFKLIFAGCQSGAELVAQWKMGTDVVEPVLEGARTMIQYWVKQENEQLAFDAFWMYYHMSLSQLRKNLPQEAEIYHSKEDGKVTLINSNEAFENDRKFQAIKSAVTYDLSTLVDRSFLCENKYITQNAVRMMRNFLEMVLIENVESAVLEDLIGRSLSYYTLEIVKEYAAKEKTSVTGFLGLFVGHTYLVDFLKKDSRLVRSVFTDWVALAKYLIENDYYIPYDLEEIGGLGRVIVARAGEILSVLEIMSALVEINQMARRKILATLRAGKGRNANASLHETVKKLDDDLRSWLSRYPRANVPDDQLAQMLKRNQW
jgi:hypothetical protein